MPKRKSSKKAKLKVEITKGRKPVDAALGSGYQGPSVVYKDKGLYKKVGEDIPEDRIKTLILLALTKLEGWVGGEDPDIAMKAVDTLLRHFGKSPVREEQENFFDGIDALKKVVEESQYRRDTGQTSNDD